MKEKLNDKEIKKYLEDYMELYPCYDGFECKVSHGKVYVSKNGEISTHCFIYDEDRPLDNHGKDWNFGALGNLVQSWEWGRRRSESKKSVRKPMKESSGIRLIPSNKKEAVKFFDKKVEIGDTFIILEYFQVGENFAVDKVKKDSYDIYDGKSVMNKSTEGMIDFLNCLGMTLEFID